MVTPLNKQLSAQFPWALLWRERHFCLFPPKKKINPIAAQPLHVILMLLFGFKNVVFVLQVMNLCFNLLQPDVPVVISCLSLHSFPFGCNNIIMSIRLNVRKMRGDVPVSIDNITVHWKWSHYGTLSFDPIYTWSLDASWVDLVHIECYLCKCNWFSKWSVKVPGNASYTNPLCDLCAWCEWQPVNMIIPFTPS